MTELGRCSLALLLLGSALYAAVPLSAQNQVDRTFALAEGLVEVETVAGSIAVRTWDRPEVRVKGTLGRGSKLVARETAGSRLQLEVESKGRGGHLSGDLQIWAPAASRFRLVTVSAEVWVTGPSAGLEVETVSGACRLELAGESDSPAAPVDSVSTDSVSIESVSGRIDARGRVGSLRVETVSGSVRFAGEARRISATSVNGRLDLRTGPLEEASIETVSGRIEFEASLLPDADIDISSHSGATDLVLPESTSATFSIETFSGRIENGLGDDGVERRRPGRREVSFRLDKGQARVDVESFSGNIRLRRQ